MVFSTNRAEGMVLTGTVDVTTADIQVSVNGAPFVSDPLLVEFDLPNFTLPHPTYRPDGLSLEPGLNVILIRTIDIVGVVSPPARVEITRLRESDVLLPEIPTGVEVRRHRDRVDILVTKPALLTGSVGGPSSTEFKGFNFYASTAPSGATGYFRINAQPVSLVSEEKEIDSYEIGSDTVSWVNSFPIGSSNLRVRVSVEDDFGVEQEVRLDQSYPLQSFPGGLRFSSSLESRTLRDCIRFSHNRAGGPNIVNEDLAQGLASEDPLYYVVTSVYYDSNTGVELESPFSQEVVGAPLLIDTNVRGLPSREEKDVRRDYIAQILRSNTDIALFPGSTTFDVSINPFTSEIFRARFLLDFVHRAGALSTLLSIDDADGDGVSDPVADSAYKTALKSALGFTSDEAVQTLIDSCFDREAVKVGKERLPGSPSEGQAVCYTETRPSFDLPIPSGTIVYTDGSPSIRYRVGGTYTMVAANAQSYYNFDTKRYEIVVDVVAESIGEDGNRSAGDIKFIEGVSGLKVTNTEATRNGKLRESNASLAERCLLGFTSVDTGTESGYLSRAAAKTGVVRSKVIKSGDLMMMRDYDSVRGKHIGGKVDVWVQGVRERQVEDNFAFTFDIARDVRVQVINPSTLIFRVLDSRVTVNTPITELLDNAPQGLGVRNVSQGLDYALTGYTILDYQTFQLNSALSGQPVTNLDDVINADYRFRAANQFVFTLQPVRRVVSVVGAVSGALSPNTGYSLFKTEDPLLEGESTIAKDYLSIQQVNGLPSGASFQVNDETHVLVGFQPELLSSIGINTRTLRVFSRDRLTEYAGPETEDPDYDVIAGTPTTPVRIVRTQNSLITDGSTVSVDYAHDENFKVTYVVNDLLQEMQRTYDVSRHTTADVLVKQAIQNSIEIETTAQLKKGASKDKTEPLVLSAISNDLNSRLIGQGAAQSDVINDIDSTRGVESSVVPMARMAYADGSRRIRESVSSANQPILSLNRGGNQVFILTSPLKSPTIHGGGLATEHKGVFQDDVGMVLSERFDLVGENANGAYILGSGGEEIVGFTDTATLLSQGFATAEAQKSERLRLTANRILVSLPYGIDPPDPLKHTYTASYIVRGDTGAKDFAPSEVEYLDLGRCTITWRNG